MFSKNNFEMNYWNISLYFWKYLKIIEDFLEPQFFIKIFVKLMFWILPKTIFSKYFHNKFWHHTVIIQYNPNQKTKQLK